jgi:hypothetical protein
VAAGAVAAVEDVAVVAVAVAADVVAVAADVVVAAAAGVVAGVTETKRRIQTMLE